MDERPRIFGADYSVYVRSVRLALAEKAVACDLLPVDVFAPDGVPADHLARQPFGRIPAFEHDGFRLYETGAILRYVDEIFAGPPLQPGSPRGRARMNQLISITDGHVYRDLVWDLYVERVSKPRQGKAPDEARIAAAVPRARTCLAAIAAIAGDGPWLVGEHLSLADLHLAPMIHYAVMTPEVQDLLQPHAGLRAWWDRMAQRPSMLATRPG